MLNLNKSNGGRVAKASGSRFENMLKNEALHRGIACTQIPTGIRVIRGPGGKLISVPIRTDYDFVFGYKGNALFVDAKSLDQSTFPYSLITKHQIEALTNMKRVGLLAGLVICFDRSKQAKVAYFDVDIINNLKPRESLRLEQGLFLGPLNNIDLTKIFDTLK